MSKENILYAVLGATGNTGSVVAETLLKAGKKVRVIGRNAEKLEKWKKQGAGVVEADLGDKDKLTDAFRGVGAAYTLIPPNFATENFGAYQDEVIENLVNALKSAKVEHVVFLSSIGAQHETGTGPIKGLFRAEQKLNDIGTNVLHLRAGYFFENHFMALGTIKQAGVNGSVVQPDVKIEMIAAPDIGTAAAEFLLQLDWQGTKVVELSGPQPLAQTEVTSMIGEAIGKSDLAYAPFPEDAVKQGMMAAGLKEDMAGQYVEMMGGLNEGKVSPEGAVKRMSTSINQYKPLFKGAWDGMN